MKHLFLFILCTVLITEASSEIEDLFVFDGSFGGSRPSTVIKEPVSKENRLRNSKRGNLVADIDQSVVDLHPLAPYLIEEALDLWNEQLTFVDDTPVIIKFATSNTSNAYTATMRVVQIDGVDYPLPLAVAKFGSELPNSSVCEINLTRNSSFWHFQGENNGAQITSNAYDFKMAALRAIAQILGFKSSLSTVPPMIEKPQMLKNWLFDKNIVDMGGVTFASINTPTQVTEFLVGKNIYWKTPGVGYKMYSPAPFAYSKTIDFFDSTDELMSYDFKTNSQIYEIDNKIATVLSDIGWPEKNFAVQIQCVNIGDNGIANINESYTFTASANNNQITDHQWEYRLMKKDKTYKTISNATTPGFTIYPQTPSSDYSRNHDGDVIGEIVLTGKKNGAPFESTYSLYLQCTPSDITCSAFERVRLNDWEFYVKTVIASKGAKHLLIGSINYDAGGLEHRSTYSGISQVEYYSSAFFYWGEAEISVRAINDFGTKVAYFPVPSDFSDPQSSIHHNSIQNEKSQETKAVKYEVYTVGGVFMGNVVSKEEFIMNNKNGVYIIKSNDKNGNIIESSKLIINR